MFRFAGWRIVVIGAIVALVCAAAAWGFQQLPSGGQVNSTDAAAGIDQTKGVDTDDPANADVVGGSLTAVTGKAVPWAIFRAGETTPAHDQIFVRSFGANNVWTTRGVGTVGGGSVSPPFAGSLNFDQAQDGEAPSIDFAGAGRAVPWATWYENTTGANFGNNNIFASRFDNTSGDPNQNKWLFEGQGRGTGGAASVPVPSLNIHTNEDAENPSLAGGATSAGQNPVPWVTWQEVDGNPTPDHIQIFTSKAVKPATGTACPAGTLPAGDLTAINTFCWQQVGIERFASGAGTKPANTTDPSMNVDMGRDGVEPDIAFTATMDTVPWVVWYEQGTPSAGLNAKELVFAAKAVAPATPPPTGTVDGGFNWIVVGRTGSGILDHTAGGGPCAANLTAENGCSLNADPTKDAEDPQIAAGTLTAGQPAAPWVVWDEGDAATPNNNSVFVAHLVGGQFSIVNNGNPIGTGDRADITFAGNTPYVTWHHNGNIVTGHFASLTSFVKDGSPLGTSAPDSVRAPISSACTANPFNGGDGSVCQGGALGTPFFLFTDGGTPAPLFADAYQPDTPTTGAPTAITGTGATLNGSVNPEGTAVSVSFNFGPTTSYGSSTTPQTIGPGDSPVTFTAPLTGLAGSTPIHYQAVVKTDFGTFLGGDQSFTTLDTTPPTVSATIAKSTIK
jgi:hypothetical protein